MRSKFFWIQSGRGVKKMRLHPPLSVTHWRIKPGSDWWFSKNVQTRTGAGSVFSEQAGLARIAKFQSVWWMCSSCCTRSAVWLLV